MDDIDWKQYRTPRISGKQRRNEMTTKTVRFDALVERKPPMRWYAMALLTAAARSGHDGTIRLAAQLADAEPCTKCGFVWNNCRCTPNIQLNSAGSQANSVSETNES